MAERAAAAAAAEAAAAWAAAAAAAGAFIHAVRPRQRHALIGARRPAERNPRPIIAALVPDGGTGRIMRTRDLSELHGRVMAEIVALARYAERLEVVGHVGRSCVARKQPHG